jgi:aconitate hydratase
MPMTIYFLLSAALVFGTAVGNGVSHPVHMERFSKPGKTLVGSIAILLRCRVFRNACHLGTSGLDVYRYYCAGQTYFV